MKKVDFEDHDPFETSNLHVIKAIDLMVKLIENVF